MKKSLVVITGASSGFGAEIAKLFNQAGLELTPSSKVSVS